MKKTDRLYNEVRTQYEQVWHNETKMVDFCVNKIQLAVKLTDGSIVFFDKPTIKKDFCFGWYTMDEKSYNEASKCAYGMAKKKSYFLHQNLQSIEDEIELVKNSTDTMYIHDAYRPEVTLKHFVFLHFTNDLWMYNNARPSANEAADKAIILEALQTIKADFSKRLETWWKKYGSEHVKTWTYCLDD